ncbi:tail fiber assembly protein [Arsenophonus apicola]|uniref:tail fiber assembly protein n=1 Tax=Arsenophonus apicola TaxID=2879119 RepID=UPI001CDCA96F|nr:tail fiber assembly protein [Arsenophonus apicola]UBX29857.1 tail fiber assembly protein [Arsenophonus apicola]
MYYYSAKENTFCPAQFKQDYIDAGSFPEDACEVSEEVWLEFAGNAPPDGKERIAGQNGLPVWVDIPPLTQDERIVMAEKEKAILMKIASEAISPLQDAVDLGIITNEEFVVLQEWKKYRVLLNRVDTSTASDIEWPKKP